MIPELLTINTAPLHIGLIIYIFIGVFVSALFLSDTDEGFTSRLVIILLWPLFVVVAICCFIFYKFKVRE